jgi:hypothetical protein
VLAGASGDSRVGAPSKQRHCGGGQSTFALTHPSNLQETTAPSVVNTPGDPVLTLMLGSYIESTLKSLLCGSQPSRRVTGQR